MVSVPRDYAVLVGETWVTVEADYVDYEDHGSDDIILKFMGSDGRIVAGFREWSCFRLEEEPKWAATVAAIREETHGG